MKRCVVCGALVEVAPVGTVAGLEVVVDRRTPAGLLVVAPPLCWDHRGEVLAAWT